MKTNGGTITNDSVNNNKDNKSDMNDIIPKLAVNNTLLNKSNNNDDVGISDINKEIIGNGVSIETFDTSSRMESLLQEFTNLYTNKLNRINGETQPTDAASLQKKISILEAWVEDLGEQNSVLVSTVEQLEKEARHRVQLLQEKLDKMAVVTKDSCISIRDHQVQVNSLISQKISAEEDAQNLRNQILSLEHRNLTLQQENSDLKDDLDSLIDVIGRVRASGKLEIDEISLKFLHPDRLTGSNSSLSGKQLVERRPADGRKSRRRSTSPVEFPGLAEEDSNQKLRSEIQMLRETKQQTNTLLLQRDQHIADLQAQLTVLHRQLTISQKQVDETTSALQSMKHRGRRDTLEICRRDDVIRHLLSPNHFEVRSEPVSLTEDDLETKGNVDLELQLNSSIDVLTARVTDLEEECQQLRHQNTVLKSAHTHCAPTINQLQDRLNNSHLSIEDLRTVLTAEVAERHDQLLSLRSQLHETRQKHTECLLQLQMKSDIIKQLTEQINSLKIIKSDKKGVGGASSEDTTSQCTQTEQRDNNKVDNEAQDANGEYILSLTLKISKLDNELSEKNILMRELQNHLSNSRQELLLKDKTLMNVEQKLDITRRSYDEKEDRMNYLTSQLTCLQLEVSRLHGTAQQLRLQLENRSTLVKKLEAENESLIWQLNDKSSMTEKFRDQTAIYESEIEKRKKELSEYKVTIGTLQDALVATKQTCDKLRKQYDTESDSKYASMTSVSSSLLHTAVDSSSPPSTRTKNGAELPPHSSSVVPDLRPVPVVTRTASLSRECPDVVSFLSRNNFEMNSLSSLSSLSADDQRHSVTNSLVDARSLGDFKSPYDVDSGPKSLMFINSDSYSRMSIKNDAPESTKGSSLYDSVLPYSVHSVPQSSATLASINGEGVLKCSDCNLALLNEKFLGARFYVARLSEKSYDVCYNNYRVTGKVEKTDTQEVGTRVHSADQQQLVLKLKGQLEDAKVQSKLLEEKCKQMEKAHESEFANFVSRLVQTHDQRLRRLQETLYSCSRNYLHCYDDSKILLKLKAVIEDLSHYLQDAHQMVLSAESDRCQIMGSAQRGIPLQSSAPTKKIEEGVFRTETGIKDLSYNDSIIEGTLPRLKLNGTSKKMNVSTRLEKDEVERGWSDQLDNRLELETSVAEDKLKKLTNEAADLKRYNDILDNQLSVSQSQAEALRSRLASLETQLQEQKIAYELLSTDANIVGGSGCYCSHHQRRASSNLLENVQPKTKPIQPFEEVKTLLKCSACHNFRRHISCERLRKEFVNNGLPTHRHPHGACGSMHTNNDHIDGCGHTEGNHHLERDCTPGYSKKVSEWGSVNRANSGAASDTPVDVIQQTACVLEYL